MRPSVAARKAARASPENGMAQHSPQPAVMEPGSGMMHPGGKTQLFAFHHIESAVERHDNLAFVVESATRRAFAVCLTIRLGGRFLFRGMSTTTATAGTGLGPIAGARFSRVGTDIVRHGNSNRLGE